MISHHDVNKKQRNVRIELIKLSERSKPCEVTVTHSVVKVSFGRHKK
jgi:hypothetical protein